MSLWVNVFIDLGMIRVVMSNTINYTVWYWVVEEDGSWGCDKIIIPAYTKFEAERVACDELDLAGFSFHLIGAEELEIEKK